MSSTFEAHVQQAMNRLAEHRERLLATSRELAAATSSVTSKDRMVTVTIGAKGEIGSLVFNTRAYRNMAPAELSSVLIDVLNRARGQMADKVASAYGSVTGLGPSVGDVLRGGTELDDVIGSLRAQWTQPTA
jgi:DNA-binding protein YbaB